MAIEPWDKGVTFARKMLGPWIFGLLLIEMKKHGDSPWVFVSASSLLAASGLCRSCPCPESVRWVGGSPAHFDSAARGVELPSGLTCHLAPFGTMGTFFPNLTSRNHASNDQARPFKPNDHA